MALLLPDNGGLNEHLPVLLDVLVCALTLLTGLVLHRHVDVHLQLLVLIPEDILKFDDMLSFTGFKSGMRYSEYLEDCKKSSSLLQCVPS